MADPILVINPNSDEEVTEEIRRVAAAYHLPDGPPIECLTIAESPRTIATDDDVAAAGIAVTELIESRPDASAYVIACFSDPGWETARTRTEAPVIGIQRAGVLAALGAAENFGVIALSEHAIPRHLKRYDEIGVRGRLAGEVGLGGVSALDAGASDAVYRDTETAGRRLVADGAQSIVLGCAGFSPRRQQLEADLGVPVIDPVKAGIAMALGLAAF